VLVIVAFLVARAQQNPGPAVWDDAVARTFTGVVSARPYPVLFANDRGDGQPGPVLLVEIGKRGGGIRAAPFDGRRTRISGWPLHRDGRWMLEMDPDPSAIRADDAAAHADVPAPHPRGRITLRGEIVDSKCFLGAMKPGEGKTHKECATLCIIGGIPPMLLTRDAAGTPMYYLLLDPSGGPLDRGAFRFIGDAVEVSGELEVQGGMLRLRVAPTDIKRL
jgi:hypothetical protein